jgi:hypothetical protein
VFGSRPVRLGGVFVMFGSFVVFISRHFSLVRCQLPARTKSPPPESFLPQITPVICRGSRNRSFFSAP